MEQVRDSDRQWRLTLQHSPVGMSLVDPQGRFLAVNDAFCEMLGYDAEAAQSLTFQEITHPDDLDADLELLEETLAGERTSYRMVKRYLHRDGSVVWADLSVALLREDDGTPIHFIGQILDITEQYEYRRKLAVAQATIDQQRRRTEAVHDTVDVGLVLLDAEGNYQTVNRRHRDFMRLAYPNGHHGHAGQPGEVYAEDGSTLLTEEQMPTYRAVRGEEFEDVRMWVGSDPATRRALSVSARSVRDHSGQFAGAALAYKDVTDYLRAASVKDEFVASVSHELRTPMTSILGHLEMLADDPSLPDDVTKRIKTVERNALRLRQLVSDLLEVQQDSSGGLVLDTRDCDLVEIVTEAVEAARPWAESSQLTLSAHLPESLMAHVDPGRIRQVVDNLVSNAIKYNEAGGSVEVSLASRQAFIRLEVMDTGLGIAPGDLERLFLRFYRGETARDRHIQGTGLGLAIVRSIAEAHGGQVSLAQRERRGAAVTVVLPSLRA
jgi:two-component system phosphate regulon sensor histidine kinase PhoR